MTKKCVPMMVKHALLLSDGDLFEYTENNIE